MISTPTLLSSAPTAAATVPAAPRLRECLICGQFQAMPVLERRAAACCTRCGNVLRQDRTDPAGRTLALAVAALLLFCLAATLPFLHLDLGSGRQTTLIAGPRALEQNGMWELGVVVLCTTMLAPPAKLAATIWVLLGLRLHWPRAQLAVVFRWVEWLSQWSMIEVFMLGVFVAYTKLGHLAPVHVGGAVYALGALMLMMAAADAVLDHEAIWERLSLPGCGCGQDRRPPIGSAATPAARSPIFAPFPLADGRIARAATRCCMPASRRACRAPGR